MAAHVTPTPSVWTEASPSPPGDVIDIVTKGSDSDSGDFAALIGGVVSVLLLLLVCGIAALLWCQSRNKGSYVTNEKDEDDAVDEDEESEGSDAALQSKAPLRSTEDE
ncbi:glycophorin-C [Halichoeres trimaculatus]|uniref:glycophorin-C n=1 Tax=Halichoeres trimaculatus TaxID=147232 RepID=UPI003D9F7324